MGRFQDVRVELTCKVQWVAGASSNQMGGCVVTESVSTNILISPIS